MFSSSAMLLEPLYTLFGTILRGLYNLTGNYGVAILVYGVAIRILLMPFNIKQHKNSLRQRALQPKLAELQRVCGKDKMRYQQEMMELYKQNGVSLTGGMGFMFLTILLMWPIYRVVQAPLTYLSSISVESLHKIADFMAANGYIAQTVAKSIETTNLDLIKALHNSPAALAEVVNQGLMKAQDLISLDFFGIDIGLTPTWNITSYFGEHSEVWLPILFIVILNLITSIFPQMLNSRLNPMLAKSKEANDLAKTNPARTAENNSADAMNRSMMITMPVMMLFFSMMMPAAMTLYWIVGNLMMMLQTYLFYVIYTRPYNDLMQKANSTSLKTRSEVAKELAKQ